MRRHDGEEGTYEELREKGKLFQTLMKNVGVLSKESNEVLQVGETNGTKIHHQNFHMLITISKMILQMLFHHNTLLRNKKLL